jgi:hypothetical protein
MPCDPACVIVSGVDSVLYSPDPNRIVPKLCARRNPMMLMYGRRILTTIVLACHAAVSLCGPGHHALGGLLERSASIDGSALQASGSPEIVAHTDKDCPACHFFSLASLPVPITPAMIRSVVEPAPHRIAPIQAVKPLPVASPPRAPPRVTV